MSKSGKKPCIKGAEGLGGDEKLERKKEDRKRGVR